MATLQKSTPRAAHSETHSTVTRIPWNPATHRQVFDFLHGPAFPSATRWLGSTALLLLASLPASAILPTQPAADSQPTTLTRLSDNSSWQASWQGVPGRTYFTQYSRDLVNWTYSPEIRTGNDATLIQGFEPEEANSFFIRRIETDEPAQDPNKADFDKDGISNIVELQRGTDPLNADSPGQNAEDGGGELARLKLFSASLSNQPLSNGQLLLGAYGTATVSLSAGATGTINDGTLMWTGGVNGNYRGLLSPQSLSTPGRAAIATIMTNGQGDLSSTLGFTANGSLNGLSSTNGMSLTIQKTTSGSYNRLISTAGSGTVWSEMNGIVSVDTPYRTMVRQEKDGFSTWIQGGIYADMGASVNSAVWFPVSRWKGMVPASNTRAGIYNSWAGPTQNSEFSDIVNPSIDASSALLDYERNKNGVHVPSLLKLPGGEVLAAWQNATNHESPDCVIKLARRNNRGMWGAASLVIGAGEDGASNHGPTLHQVGKEIWLTYQSTSASGGYTVRKRVVTVQGDDFILSSPVTLFSSGLVINHFLVLPSGRIIACWHTQVSQWKNRISYSDDGGATWTAAQFPEFHNRAGEGFAIIEADGTLSCYWRTDQAAIYRAVSLNDGTSWSPLMRTSIPCANMPSQGLLGSRVCGYKRPSDGKVVIIGNNSTTQREKLTVWLVNNGTVEGTQSLLPWDVTDGSAEGLHYPDLIVHPDNSMTVIFARWLGGGLGSSELHSAINTFRVPANFN